MAKKPVIEDTLDSVTEIEDSPPDVAVIEPTFGGDLAAVTRALERTGYVVMTRADYDELQRNLKMAR